MFRITLSLWSKRNTSLLLPSGDKQQELDCGRYIRPGQHVLHPGRLLHRVLQLFHSGSSEQLLGPDCGSSGRSGGPAGQRSNSARVRQQPVTRWLCCCVVLNSTLCRSLPLSVEQSSINVAPTDAEGPGNVAAVPELHLLPTL